MQKKVIKHNEEFKEGPSPVLRYLSKGSLSIVKRRFVTLFE